MPKLYTPNESKKLPKMFPLRTDETEKIERKYVATVVLLDKFYAAATNIMSGKKE